MAVTPTEGGTVGPGTASGENVVVHRHRVSGAAGATPLFRVSVKPDPRRRTTQPIGEALKAGRLGDVVAGVLSRVGIRECAPCARRKASLNDAGRRIAAIFSGRP